MITKTRIIPDGKALLKTLPYEPYLEAERLYYPITSGRCPEGSASVKVGEKVYVGQVIGARRSGFFDQNIHSTVSGTVVGFEMRRLGSGKKVECIVVENDQKYTLHETVKDRTQEEIDNLTREELLKIIKDFSLVGLGGSEFPTHIKFKTDEKINVIVANGVECEPYLVSDYGLMKKEPEKIVEGLIIAMKTANAPKGVIAIKKKYKAIKAILEETIKNYPEYDITVAPIGNYYPQGWELEVIKNAVGIKIPQFQLLAKYGVLQFNVSTLLSIYNAVKHRLPVLERFITISGDGVHNKSFVARIGTPVNELVELAGGYKDLEQPKVLVVGGPMMGSNASSDDLIMTFTTTSLIVLNEVVHKEEPCIHCAACVYSCPVKIQPVQIMNAYKAGDKKTLEVLQVNKCIECGLCSFVCPSKIHLTDYMRKGKAMLRG